jgi:REP element-mobilizing transposase RayT
VNPNPLIPNSSALRRGRHSAVGQLYLVTFSTWNRSRLFVEDRVADMACTILDDPQSWPGADPLVWVLMPDHAHVLLQLNGDESLSRTIGRVKGCISRRLGSHATPIWQPSFHDHVLRKEESLVDVGRYVLANPVSAGLVQRIDQWRWRGGQLQRNLEEDLPFGEIRGF